MAYSSWKAKVKLDLRKNECRRSPHLLDNGVEHRREIPNVFYGKDRVQHPSLFAVMIACDHGVLD